MLCLLLISLLLVALDARHGQDQFAIKRPFRRCFVNEEFSECASQCEPTCKNPNPGVCSLQCVAGCQCKPGFLRNEHGACVDDCKNGETLRPVCGANEEFTECGTACEPTCREPRPKICTLQCVVGCQCKKGFFRNDKNECVAECDNASSNICAENEEFRECGTACEPTCENPFPAVCTAQCIVNVCQCKHGFFRNSEKKCVQHCGPESNIMPISSLKGEGTTVTTAHVQRSARSQPPCGTNEERVECGTACEPTCSDPNPICTKQCIKNVCRCRFGFIRNSKNQCIPTNACPPSERPCGTNEERKQCGTACEPTCANPNPRCTKQCIINVCQCRDGFIRNSKNQCIPKNACPPSETTTMPPADCSAILCPPGTTCTMVEVSCPKPPCPASSPKCVPVSVNPPMMCGPHETWKNCSGCEPTCTNMNPACGFSCGPPRCECDPGFFRSQTGRCVTMAECRR